jgi:hypothetical protein
MSVPAFPERPGAAARWARFCWTAAEAFTGGMSFTPEAAAIAGRIELDNGTRSVP